MPRGSPTAERLAALETRAELGAADREAIKETLGGIRKDLTALMGSTSRLEAIVTVSYTHLTLPTNREV